MPMMVFMMPMMLMMVMIAVMMMMMSMIAVMMMPTTVLSPSPLCFFPQGGVTVSRVGTLEHNEGTLLLV